MSQAKAHKIRKFRRVELRCSLGFSSEDFEGEGKVKNISTAGCRAESDINVAEGLEFLALLHLPDQSPPIRIDRAIVRWIDGNSFGLSFTLILPSERARLRGFLEKRK